MFSLMTNEAHSQIMEKCMAQLYTTVDAFMFALNADIMALNNSLKQDQLQLTISNPLVSSIMHKIDIIGSFIKMIFRVFEKITSKPMQAFYTFILSPHMASILVRVFGIGI